MGALDDLLAHVSHIPRVYKLGKVPASPVYPYAVASLSSPSDLGRMLCGDTWTDQRLVVQMFGRDVDGVTALAAKFDAEFKDRVLSDLPGEPFSWRELAVGPNRDPDDGGVIGITHTYRT